VDAEAARRLGASVYYASVYEKDGKIYTSASRAVGVLGRAKSVEDAEKVAEMACGCVNGQVWHRSDIGTSDLIAKRIAHMRSLRGRP
jgi:phosphoribosylamine--glycine ligase